MDVNALRNWGVAVSAALMAGALAVSLQNPPPASASAPSAAGSALAQTVQREASPAFIVRFRGAGPIARAQARAARGDTALAQRQIEIQLARQSAFAGLCFDRFTAGGAEVVLRTCEAVPGGQFEAERARWLARLRAMRAVEYVDANVTATQERAPG